MKKIRNALTGIVACAFLGCVALAADNSDKAERTALSGAQWNVRVEVLMVAMPEEKALELLPDLRAPDKIEGAVTRIMDAIKRKDALLTGYPVVHAVNGERATSEAILEHRYPTEFALPEETGTAPTAPNTTPTSEPALPTAFETRNVGVSLEVKPQVLPGGDWIRLMLAPQRVELLYTQTYDSATSTSKKGVTIDQPIFYTTKITTTTILRNGQRSLLAVHKLVKPENYIEFFIIQAVATPVK